jgi:type II secretory pathway pseudopilin PulG
MQNTSEAIARRQQSGFNYPVLLAAMVLAGILLAGIGEVWRTVAIREKEAQLLFVGNEFSQAIGRYYESTPSGPKQYPQSLEDLLLDRRFPRIVRHLRKLYADPISAKPDWALILEQGRIIGVHSQAEGTPLRTLGVPASSTPGMIVGGNTAANEDLSYSNWRFIYRPMIMVTAGTPFLPQPTTDGFGDGSNPKTPITRR